MALSAIMEPQRGKEPYPWGLSMSEHPYWIAFGDIHGHTAAFRRIPELAGATGVLITGDLTNVGGVAEAKEVVEAVKAVNPRILAQIGNMDLAPVEAWLDAQGMGMHRKAIELAPGLGIMGVGWSNPTPFGTPSEAPDATLGQWLAETYEKAKAFAHLILASHTPPFGGKGDVVGNGAHVGSKAVREFILRVKPALCLTGHIHEAQSLETIGETLVVNPGDLASGGYVRVGYDGHAVTAELLRVRP